MVLCKAEVVPPPETEPESDKMLAKNENAVPPSPTKEIDDSCDASDDSYPNACASMAVTGGKSPIAAPSTPKSSEEEDTFYEKLTKLNESSGLSLLFNFRETNLDLHGLYKNVTERGGYHQVTRDGSWGEVASGLILKGGVPMSLIQLQKLYASILYQFEQAYHYRTPAKLIEALGDSSSIADGSSCSMGKRKHCDSSYSLSYKKTLCYNDSSKLSTVVRAEEKKLHMQTPPKSKETKKDPKAPLGPRTCYQIFVKIECDRLKRIHGENSPGILNIATEAWRQLSDDDKKPYIEASRKDKERFIREMAAYKERKSKQQTEVQKMPPKLINFTMPLGKDGNYNVVSHNDGGIKSEHTCSSPNQKVIDFAKPLQSTDGDYHVSLQPTDAETVNVSDESMVELAAGMLKNARPNDPIFQINWDEYCGSLDIPG